MMTGHRPRTAASLPVWLMLAASFSAAGCGGRTASLPGTVPVAGAVTFGGEPLVEGTIRFSPEDGGQPATGAIVGGRFQMKTTASSPGVLKGKYRVSVVSEKPGSIAELPPGTPPDPSRIPVAESLVPKRYTDPRTSGFEVEVTGPVSDLTFALEGK